MKREQQAISVLAPALFDSPTKKKKENHYDWR
jgi:hypothetical protein